MPGKLKAKYRAFAEEYVKIGNVYQSAIKVGYSETYAKTHAYKLLENASVKNYIEQLQAELSSKRIASAEEVLQHLTSAMRGEIKEEVVVVEGIGDYQSEARIVNKQIGLKDRIKAAELLGKRHLLFTEKVKIEGTHSVMIVGEDDLEE